MGNYFSDMDLKGASSKRKRGVGCSVLWDKTRDENLTGVLGSNILWVGTKPLRKYNLVIQTQLSVLFCFSVFLLWINLSHLLY